MSENCNKLHQWFNNLPKLSFPFDEKNIPLNGIYILFEKGESAHSTSRVVRVGMHTGNDQLRSRLFQHFLNKNKDRSIFRKNIGRALLNKDKDPFLEQWVQTPKFKSYFFTLYKSPSTKLPSKLTENTINSFFGEPSLDNSRKIWSIYSLMVWENLKK